MTHLPLAVRRMLAIALGCIPLLIVWTLVVRPLYEVTTAAIERLDDARFEQQRLRRLTTDSNALTPEELEGQSHELAVWVFRSRKDNAAVLGAVDALVRSVGVELTELRATEPRDQGSLTQFSIDLRLSAPEARLIQLLKAFADHRPLLTVDRTVILSPAVGADLHPSTLTVELRVSGYGADVPVLSSKEGANAQ